LGIEMLKIYKSDNHYRKAFTNEKKWIKSILGNDYVVEHIGSTAVPGLDGKGVIDILIGVDNENQINDAAQILAKNGYFYGRGKSDDSGRVFMASSELDTTEGDLHLHLVLKTSNDFNDFIKFRDFLRQNPSEARKYSDLKYKMAERVGSDREEYKKQKSDFIEGILLSDILINK
jgi:GrpB-like predicted nucleotidyltransferase (UPF0157 family)